MWGEWQVGQQTASTYATTARQWAHAIKLVDPTVKLVGCGETGSSSWDGVVLDDLVDKIDLHRCVNVFYDHSSIHELSCSIHLYTGFGERDRTQTDKEYGRSVYGPDAAEYSIEVARGLINKAVGLNSIHTSIFVLYLIRYVTYRDSGSLEKFISQLSSRLMSTASG